MAGACCKPTDTIYQGLQGRNQHDHEGPWPHCSSHPKPRQLHRAEPSARGTPTEPCTPHFSPLPNKPITNPSLPAPFSGWHGSEADADTTQVGVRGKPDGPRWLRSSWPGAAPGLCTQRKRPRHRAAGARLAGHLGETLQLF